MKDSIINIGTQSIVGKNAVSTTGNFGRAKRLKRKLKSRMCAKKNPRLFWVGVLN
jgi:hypothetical protein